MKYINFILLLLIIINISEAFAKSDNGKNITKTGKIEITRNIIFSDFSTSDLKKQLLLKEGQPSQKYQLKLDKERLENFYRQNGYLKAKVINYYQGYNLQKNINTYYFHIYEGPPTIVRKINIYGDSVSNEVINKIISTLKSKKFDIGLPYNKYNLRDGLKIITDEYSNDGYIYADFKRVECFLNNERLVDVNLILNKGKRVFVKDIEIQGNKRVRRAIIWRELTLKPGEPISPKKIYTSQQRVYSTGLFREVYFDTPKIVDGDSSNVILTLNVKELKLGWYGFTMGYESPDVLRGSIGWGHDNIFNNGQKIGITCFLSYQPKYRWIYRPEIVYKEPWFLSRRLALESKLFYEKNYFIKDYQLERTGLSFQLSKSFLETYLLSSRFKYELVNTFHKESDRKDIIVGRKTTNSVLLTISEDTRDNPFNPKRGLLWTASGEVAGGFIEGNNSFLKGIGSVSYFWSIYEPFVLAFRTYGGYVVAYGKTKYGVPKTVPSQEEFTAGGANSIRGFSERTIPPANTSDPKKYEGNIIGLGNIELRFPIYSAFGGTIFVDSGNLWLTKNEGGDSSPNFSNIHISSGIGIRYNTPVGPIRLDYGIRLEKDIELWNMNGIHFSLGHAF